jgi:hypothetical protein
MTRLREVPDRAGGLRVEGVGGRLSLRTAVASGGYGDVDMDVLLDVVRCFSCRITEPSSDKHAMLGFKSFWSAAVTLAGVELMHMIRKGQLLLRGELCPAQQFYSLAE